MDIDPHTLPEEASLLRQIVLQLLGMVEEKDRLLERVQHQLKQLLRQRYGQKRERIDENQLFLFAAQIIAASQASAASARPEPPATGSAANTSSQETKQRNGHGRKPLPASLERRRVLFDLDETQRQCPHCRSERQRIGEDISERLKFVPASLHVIEEVRPKYACAKGCGMATAPKPVAPIEKGLPGPGLLAQVVVSKYGDHLPLNRLESIFQRQGVELSRKTMCGWMGACAELAGPVWERMKQVVLASKVVQTDDTPVPVQDAELTRTRKGRLWTYVGDRHHPYIVYDYTGNRSGQEPEEFLRGYRGYVQADAYSGYDALCKNREQQLTEVGAGPTCAGSTMRRRRQTCVAPPWSWPTLDCSMRWSGKPGTAHCMPPNAERYVKLRRVPYWTTSKLICKPKSPRYYPRAQSEMPSTIPGRTGMRWCATAKTGIWRSTITAPSAASATSWWAETTGSSTAATRAGEPGPSLPARSQPSSASTSNPLP